MVQQWFKEFFSHLESVLKIPITTIQSHFLTFPHLYVDTTEYTYFLDRGCGCISFHIATSMEERCDGHGKDLLLRQICSQPLSFNEMEGTLKEIKRQTKTDKKVSYLILHYDWFMKRIL